MGLASYWTKRPDLLGRIKRLERELDSLRAELEAAKRERDEAKRAATDINNTLFDVLAREQDAEQSLAEQRKDAERMDWIIDHGMMVGGGSGMTVSFRVPDSECIRSAIDQAIGPPSAEPRERKGD